MNKNDAVKKHKCTLCEYATSRKSDLKRHHTAKHIYTITPVCEYVILEKNVTPNEKNVTPNEKFVTPQLICKKCNKIYKTKGSFESHEVKCNGVDELTCPRCMISFSSRQHKSRHILNNKCKPRSIMHARTPNADNIVHINTQNNIDTQNNIQTQNNNNTIVINNYGNERTDYLDYDKMLEIFKTAYNIPSALTKYIHFNKEFPENNNIIHNKIDTDYPLVKIEGEYIYRSINNLVQELVKDKTRMMHHFAKTNKDDICVKMDTQIYEEIIDLLLKLLQLQEPSDHYKIQLANIRDLIKNSARV
jgi:hypothetical protein